MAQTRKEEADRSAPDERVWTAALVIIGDEILSGRTQDRNVAQIATWLNVQGIRLKEVRVVADDMAAIGGAVTALAAAHDYLFTTGGIGPTHDDITVDAIAAALGVPVCLMHMQGEPRTMQDDPRYDDVVGEVHRFLAERLFACQMAGIDKKNILVDPGFGFGKTLEHNLELLRALGRFTELAPVMAGLSRKGMIGALTGRERPADRVAGSIAAAVLAAGQGAAIVRVHDVAATRDALAVWAGFAARGVVPRRTPRPERTASFDED